MTPKVAKDDKSLTSNTSERVVSQQDIADAVGTSRRPSARTTTKATSSAGATLDKNTAKTLIRKRPSVTIVGTTVATSKPGMKHAARAVTRNTNTTPPSRTSKNSNNNNNNNNKDTYRPRIDVQDEPSLMPPNRIPMSLEESPQSCSLDGTNSEEDESGLGVPSSSTSTTSSFLQAAAIPPRLMTQRSTPGAICVPGFSSFNDNHQHDNLLDMEEEDDDNYNDNNNNPNGVMSIPHVVAELAPNYFSEQVVEDRLAERLAAQMEAHMSERLQQEVERQVFQERRQHAIAEVVSSSNGNGNDNKVVSSSNDNGNDNIYNEQDGNFKICGIRRTCWGMILCVIMLLVIGGVTGTYLWFSRVREEENTNIYGANNNDNDRPLPQSSPAPTSSNITPAPTSSNITPAPTSSNITNNTSFPSIDSTIDRRWDYLMTSIGPYIVPENFVENPEKYFDTDTNNSRYAGLDWIASLDLETDIFAMPIQLLVERYVLTVLYYSTGGVRTWIEPLSFLSSKDACDWNNGVTIVGKTNITEEDSDDILVQKGVFCSNGPYVTSIQIPSNSLQGTIPWELSLLEYLIQIDFDTNEFYGSVPVELSRLSKLQALWFKDNDLTGTLPLEFENATKLASLDLKGNSLTSTLPSEYGSLSNLFYISLRLNNITGTLPPEWHELSNLKTFDIEGNQLDGTLPEEYGELTKLRALYFDSNHFEGSLPTTFGNLTNIRNLYVNDNLLSGSVPAEYSALTNLEFFLFHGNLLTGSVDDAFCDDSYTLLNGTYLISDCFSNDSDGLPAQIECSCCTECCDTGSNGTYCVNNTSY